MELFHGSNEKNLKVCNDSGLFGEFLFFSSRKEAATSHGIYLYKIKINEVCITSPYEMFYMLNYEDDEYDRLQEVAKHVAEICDVDAGIAEDLLSERKTINGELGWFVQKQIARCSKILGFDGVKVRDEHGSSYMINMINRDLSRA